MTDEVNSRVALDSCGLITLIGSGGEHQVLSMNTCDRSRSGRPIDCFDQEGPQLLVENMTFEIRYSAVRQTTTSV